MTKPVLYRKEITDIQDHPEGGEVITLQWLSDNICTMQNDRRGLLYFCSLGKHYVDRQTCKSHPTVLEVRTYLRISGYEWFTWPDCQKVGLNKTDLEDCYESHQVRQKYAPKTPLKIQPKGNANRCMFCHTDLSGLAAQCLKCGGAMHLDCAKEKDNVCQTPGCAPDKEKQSDKLSITA